MEPVWQDAEQEAPDELVGGDRHGAEPRRPVAAIVLVAEGDAALVEAEQAAVRDGDAVGVAGEIGEHRFGPGGGRWLDVEEPFLPAERGKMCGQGFPATQAFELAEERQRARRVGIGEARQEEPPGPAGEGPPPPEGTPPARDPARPVASAPPPPPDHGEELRRGQRSTWPPRAAERQGWMADIGWSWSRLRCPALALRQAAPW